MAQKAAQSSGVDSAAKPGLLGNKNQKTIKLKHHHAKAYRKRHVSALFIFIILSSVLITWLVIYREQVVNRVDSAQNFLSDVFNPAATTQQNVNSTYGFSMQYDARTFSGSAIDAATGDLFIGQELSTNRAYQTVRISTGSSDVTKNSQRSLTINYYDNVPAANLADTKLTDMESKVAASGLDLSKVTLSQITKANQTIEGVAFKVSEWTVVFKNPGIVSKVPIGFRTYAGIVHGRVLIMKLSYGLSINSNREVFKSIISSLKFGLRTQSAVKADIKIADKITSSLSILDRITFTASAHASPVTGDNTEQVSSRYSPAVVKVYNLYCMDINIDDVLFEKDICDGGTGTGFFVDGKGDIATNGHVATGDAQDIVIRDAVTNLIAGDNTNFLYLVKMAGIKDTDFTGGETASEIVNLAVDKMYAIDAKRIIPVNNVTNLLVGLNEKQPNITELVNDTKNRKTYAEQDSVKKATLIAKDYRVIDGITSFKASDVALIKIAGNNFPVTKLGSINNIAQGAGLLILGYPGEASNNGLVDSTISKPTLTAGKVSAIKTVAGGSKKLIETDATIGHGNSGGPVFDQAGNVFGIATYTIDGSGKGDGIFNYIRDIQDLKDLAAKNSVIINGTSPTQIEWNNGIDLFYKAHYSAAVKSFVRVRNLYPQSPKVDELIATANERIKSGQEVKSFPVALVIVTGISVLGIGASAFLIFRHYKAHGVYMGHVAAGTMEPMHPGTQPRVMSYGPHLIPRMPSK